MDARFNTKPDNVYGLLIADVCEDDIVISKLSTAWTMSKFDPAYVECSMQSAKGPIPWIIGRKLLSEIVDLQDLAISGQGDVRGNVMSLRDRHVALITFESPDGLVDLAFPLEGLKRFLSSSYDLVSEAEETAMVSDELDLYLATLELAD